MLAAEPYPARSRRSPRGTSRATSSTSRATAPPTRTRTRASGCDTIGLPHDELYCSDDKIARCLEIGIDVLIDDSPVNLVRAPSRTGSPPRRSSTRGTATSTDVIMRAGLADAGAAAGAGARVSDDASELPAPPDHRAYLPAVEPERQITDWGRSERVESALDKTLYEFLYHYWFRVTVEGIEHVPATGGALLVSNHAGALPPDAAMIAKAIKTEHPRPRPLHLTVEHFFKGYPGLCMLVSKLGGVPAHPANVHRLLYDEEQLVLVFPEGRKGTEKLYKDRYQLRRFGRGGFVESAMRARRRRSSPSRSSAPRRRCRSSATSSRCKKLTGLIYFPVTPTVPAGSASRGAAYLPAKFHIRFLEPIPTDQWGEEPWNDKGLVQTVAEEVRARIQEELYDDARRPPSRSGSG